MLTKLMQKGDEVGLISASDDQSSGMFCPIFQVRDEELAPMFIAGWNSHIEESEVRAESQEQAPCPVCANLRETNRELSSKYDALQARGDEQSGLIDRLKQEAQVHAQEARTANSTIAEIYQAISGATGEPGNWHGAAPVREYIAQQDKIVAQQAERIAEIEAKPAARYLNTNAHLESVIAEQAALIEKCEKALNVVTVMPKSHESVRLAVQSLAAIATHRSQS